MDLKVPQLNGIEATCQILNSCSNFQIIVFTRNEDDDLVFSALRAGAQGYFWKGAQENEILLAIQGVSNGKVILNLGFARRLMQFFAAPPHEVSSHVFPELPEQKTEINRLIAQEKR
jgi:DNA-binding NarL/FixJ family response regulator